MAVENLRGPGEAVLPLHAPGTGGRMSPIWLSARRLHVRRDPAAGCRGQGYRSRRYPGLFRGGRPEERVRGRRHDDRWYPGPRRGMEGTGTPVVDHGPAPVQDCSVFHLPLRPVQYQGPAATPGSTWCGAGPDAMRLDDQRVWRVRKRYNLPQQPRVGAGLAPKAHEHHRLVELQEAFEQRGKCRRAF